MQIINFCGHLKCIVKSDINLHLRAKNSSAFKEVLKLELY